MPSGATYPAEAHMRISDAWLNANAGDGNAVRYCEYLDGESVKHNPNADGRTGLARGILIRGDSTGNGNVGVVRGYLWAENPSDADDYYLSANSIHSLRFKRIYAQGTTARGIKVLY